MKLEGKTFGRLTVIERAANRKKKIYWKCECECGVIKDISQECLRKGFTTSCGYLARELSRMRIKHGGSRRGKWDAEYIVWTGMINRCCNPHHHSYYRYGGRGITVCERWRNSFASFVEDMGRKPGKDYILDRINNNNGNYDP